MLIAVTGASGDVGSEVVKVVLASGHAVRAIDVSENMQLEGSTDKVEFVRADLCSYEKVLEVLKGCDAVISSAGIPNCINHPEHIVHNINVTISFNILRASAEHGITRVCQLSSINSTGSSFHPYHRNYKYFPIDEKIPGEVADTYALSKQICEVQAEMMSRAYPKMRIASIRPAACLPEAPAPLSERNAFDESKHGKRDEPPINDAFAWSLNNSVAKACLLAVTSEGWSGHEAFYIISPVTTEKCFKGTDAKSSAVLAKEHFPDTSVREGWFEGEENSFRGFYDTSKAESLLGWKHGM